MYESDGAHSVDIGIKYIPMCHDIGGSRIFPGGSANPRGRRQNMILLNVHKKLH